jgi:hypothetical protein
MSTGVCDLCFVGVTDTDRTSRVKLLHFTPHIQE